MLQRAQSTRGAEIDLAALRQDNCWVAQLKKIFTFVTI
jgi:hypothetical protein